MTAEPRAFKIAIAFAALVGLATVAWADDVASYQVSGRAPSVVSDPRTAALDDAFARAARAALVDMVAAEQRASHQGDLDREIVARARRWVTTFSVTKDVATSGRRELVVAVSIDRDKIRNRLDELHIGLTPRAQPSIPTIAIDVRVSAPVGVRTADVVAAGFEAMTAVFRSGGLTVRGGPLRRSRGDGAVPEQAGAGGGKLGADLAVAAEVIVGTPAFVRGQARGVVLVTANVRVSDRRSVELQRTADRTAGRMVAQESAAAAAPADDPPSGAKRALTSAATAVLPRLPANLVPPAQRHDKRDKRDPVGDSGVVLVRLSPGTPYATVVAEQQLLAGAKGVREASVRRLSSRGWVIGATTDQSIDRIAQVAAQPPSNDVQVGVKIDGGIVDVTVSEVP